MKTPEELAEEWSAVTFDESELPEHEKTKLSDLATYRAMGTLGFLAGYQAAMPQWISVKDRLPESDTYVLVTDGLKVFRSKVWEEFFDMGPVTHWMPLPAVSL